MNRGTVVPVFMKLLILAIAVVLSLGPQRVLAQPTDPDKAAQAHFKQGKAYLDAGVYDEAIKELEAGYKLSPLPEFLFNIGQAYRLAGNKVAAKQSYLKYVELVPDGEFADQARVIIATLTKQIIDEAKATDEANKKQAAAAEVANHQVATVGVQNKLTEQTKLDIRSQLLTFSKLGHQHL